MLARRAVSHARSSRLKTVSSVGVGVTASATLLGLVGAASHLSSRSRSSDMSPSRSLLRPAFAESTLDAPSEPPSDAPDHQASARESNASPHSPDSSAESKSSGPPPSILSSVHSKLQEYEAYRYMVTVAEDNGTFVLLLVSSVKFLPFRLPYALTCFR